MKSILITFSENKSFAEKVYYSGSAFIKKTLQPGGGGGGGGGSGGGH